MDLHRLVAVLKAREEKIAKMKAIYDYIVIVAGSRTFNDYALFSEIMALWLKDHPEVHYGTHIFLSGDAEEGPDHMVLKWCDEYPLDRPVETLPALWWAYGKPAGILRNIEMGDCATHCIAFWDTRSPGTKHMLGYAKQKGLDTQPVLVDPD